jgi:hypothetical protein
MSQRKKGIYKPWNVGQPHSEETKLKISLSKKGSPGNPGLRKRYICVHCQAIVGGESNLNRWHMDNCKQRKSIDDNRRNI